jgi:hypothetical protein
MFDAKDIDNALSASAEKLSATAISDTAGIDDSKMISCKASELLLNIVGVIAPGKFVEFCTAGEFSVHQLLQYLLTHTGAADVYISTWTLKEEPARVLYFLKKTGKIKKLFCVFDYRIRTLDAKHFDFIEKVVDGYVLTKCHAKVMAIDGERMGVSVISSANMSNNPRIEAGVISCTAKSMEFHKGWIMDVINGKKVY